MSINQVRRRIRAQIIGKYLFWILIRAVAIIALFILLEFIYQRGRFEFIESETIQAYASFLTQANVYRFFQNIILTFAVWFFLSISKKIIIPASIIAISPAVGKIVHNQTAEKKFNKTLSQYLTFAVYFIVIGAFILIWTYSFIGTWIADLLGSSLIIMLTFVLGLFSSSVLGNILGYAIIGGTHELKVGDHIQIDDTRGDVIDVGFFFTHIKTIRDEIISIPNLTVMNKEIHNFSTLQEVALNVQVTLGYDVDKDYAQVTLIEAALKTDGILFSADKSPFVLLRELGSYSITYEINAYIDEPNRIARIKSNLISNMIEELQSAGIEIATPTLVAIKGDEKALPHTIVQKANNKKSTETTD
jgi:small-conductance mechanosensitive channel